MNFKLYLATIVILITGQIGIARDVFLTNHTPFTLHVTASAVGSKDRNYTMAPGQTENLDIFAGNLLTDITAQTISAYTNTPKGERVDTIRISAQQAAFAQLGLATETTVYVKQIPDKLVGLSIAEINNLLSQSATVLRSKPYKSLGQSVYNNCHIFPSFSKNANDVLSEGLEIICAP